MSLNSYPSQTLNTTARASNHSSQLGKAPTIFDQKLLFVMASIVIGTLLLCSGLLKQQNKNYFQTKEYAVLDFNLVNKDGKAVNGAKIFINGAYAGVTDSFGNWRQFARVSLGQALVVRFHKQLGETSYQAEREVITPKIPAKGKDLEIRLHLQMQETAQLANL